MQRVQRITGRFLTRTPNEADVDAMLHDFNDSKAMLEKLETSAKQWRDAWTNILNHQLSTIEYLLGIFKPLGGEGSGGHVAAETPLEALERVTGLLEAFSDLKTDMMEEIKDIDRKLIIPAKLARDALKPMEKAIKKREDAKIDYERYKSRCEALQKKTTRSQRENAALAKHEVDLDRSTHAYQLADENLRDRLPRLNAATFSILPHLLSNQIVLQNNLIGNLYTVLHQYSNQQGYPDPPPEPEEVIPMWDSSFTPLRKEIESGFTVLKQGKAIHLPMRLPDKGETMTGLGIRNKVMPGRRVSSDVVPAPMGRASAKPTTSLPPHSENGPVVNLSNKPSYNSLNASRPQMGSASPNLTPNPDQWSRRPSATSQTSSYSNGTNGNNDYFGKVPSGGSYGRHSPSVAAIKKKPPPPPPPKKIGSFQYAFVTAMYDFDSHTPGDLSFREGDRIRVVKKTESSQDWWEGELRGTKGSFPANYCK